MKTCKNPDCTCINPQFAKYNGVPNNFPLCKDCMHQQYLKSNPNAKRRPHLKQRSSWTLEEENELVAKFATHTNKQLQVILNKSQSSIKNKCIEYKLRKLTYASEFYDLWYSNDNLNRSGIYVIINETKGMFYIGSTININKRIHQHKLSIINKTHDLKIMTNDFLSGDRFRFAVVSFSDIEQAQIIEHELLNTYRHSGYLYNKSIISDRPIINRTIRNRILTHYEIIDDCWIYRGGGGKKDYKYIKIDNKAYPVHRLSYLIHYNQWPAGLHVLHKCNNKHCINPEHLKIGSNFENVLDRSKSATLE